MVVDAQFEFEWDSQFAALCSCGEIALYFDLNKDGTGYVHNGGWHFKDAVLDNGSITFTIVETTSVVKYLNVVKNPKYSS